MNGNNPNGIPEGVDGNLQHDSIEVDMLQSGPVDWVIKAKSFARGEWYEERYTFTPEQSLIYTQLQGRQVRHRLESNVQGGSFSLGRTILMLDMQGADNRHKKVASTL